MGAATASGDIWPERPIGRLCPNITIGGRTDPSSSAARRARFLGGREKVLSRVQRSAWLAREVAREVDSACEGNIGVFFNAGYYFDPVIEGPERRAGRWGVPRLPPPFPQVPPLGRDDIRRIEVGVRSTWPRGHVARQMLGALADLYRVVETAGRWPREWPPHWVALACVSLGPPTFRPAAGFYPINVDAPCASLGEYAVIDDTRTLLSERRASTRSVPSARSAIPEHFRSMRRCGDMRGPRPCSTLHAALPLNCTSPG